MKLSTLADLVAVATLKEKDFPTATGLVVRIRELTLAQRSEFQLRVASESKSTVSAWLTTTACVNDAGAKVFSDDDEKVVAALSPQVLEEIGLEVLRLSGLAAPGKDSAQTSGSVTD